MTNKKTTITDISGRVSTYWFDKAMYTFQIQDSEGKSSYTEYFMHGGTNKYGDVKSTTDRNGNKTSYQIDDNSNVIKNTNPDGSVRLFEYDDKYNLVKETYEAVRLSYYVYDENKISLIKKVRPINSTNLYTGIDTSNKGTVLLLCRIVSGIMDKNEVGDGFTKASKRKK